MKILYWVQDQFTGIKAVTIDGLLEWINAIFGSALLYFSTEEAYKYIDPTYLFWIKVIFGANLAGIVALRNFRNKQYAQYITDKEKQQDKIKL